MSNPINPLNKFNSTSLRHILVAFKYTEDAEKTPITYSLGNPGAVFSAKKGPGIVIVNEFTGSDFNIYSARWTWNFFGPLTATCSSCVGSIEIADRTGLHFPDFMKTRVIPALGVSEGHMVFALRTYFIGDSIKPDGKDMVVGNPFIFNMVTMINDLSPQSGRFYTLGIVGASTTYAQTNQYSKIYKMTITHSDGNLHKETPIPKVPTCSMKTRKDEDNIQNSERKKRIDRSKPMRSLKEVFAAFENELNQQKFTDAAQLQSWLSQLNNNYDVKIIPPIQTKLGGIPVDYIIHLDPIYNEYEVDNRNLPFEQPEQDQNKKGIRSIPVKIGMNIPNMVEKLMKLSQKVGQDSELLKPYIFKTAMSIIKTVTDRYQIHVVIKRIKVPENHISYTTGPGESAVSIPLEFSYQDPRFEDRDIISLNAKTVSDNSLKILEQQTQNTAALVVYGDREQISAERIPNIEYFQSQYSGLRPMINPLENNGLESGVNASKIDNNINVEIMQSTSYNLVINGNPNLLSDLNRLPSDVALGNIGNAQLYKYPELDPMYVKLTIFLKPHAALGLYENSNVSNKFYYDGYYHMASVTNIFEQALFLQELRLLRTDESI